MKHYFIHAAVEGVLVGIACIDISVRIATMLTDNIHREVGIFAGLFIGVIFALGMAFWKIKSVEDAVIDDKQEEVRR